MMEIQIEDVDFEDFALVLCIVHDIFIEIESELNNGSVEYITFFFQEERSSHF